METRYQENLVQDKLYKVNCSIPSVKTLGTLAKILHILTYFCSLLNLLIYPFIIKCYVNKQDLMNNSISAPERGRQGCSIIFPIGLQFSDQFFRTLIPINVDVTSNLLRTLDIFLWTLFRLTLGIGP